MKSSEESLEENKFYKALKFILKIKKGLPRTENILVNNLRQYITTIKDSLLEKLVKMILYKYSEEGIVYNIFIIEFLFNLIGKGKLNFKKYLKKIVLDGSLKRDSMVLKLFESKNEHIINFFNEMKDELDISQNDNLTYRDIISDLENSSLEKSKLFKLFQSSSEKELNSLASMVEKDLFNTEGAKILEKALEIMKKENLEDFYKRAEKSNDLKRIMPKLAEKAMEYDRVDLAERIIDLCMKDNHLCEESEELHNRIAKGDEFLPISTMRAYLCLSIDRYIGKYLIKTDKKSLEKLEKSFYWVKSLIDLDGSLADRIKDFPKPNYYLRTFAIIPLQRLAHYKIRNRLNGLKKGLGDKIKNFAFCLIEKTKEETKKNNYKPYELLKRIPHLFRSIKDLNEKEAEKFLSFIEDFKIGEANHFFIYYALFREKHFKEKGGFDSKDFKNMLKDICKGKPGALKYRVSYTIYEAVKNKKQNGESQPDLDFFEKVKDDYWVPLFDNRSREMFSPLSMTLRFVLGENKYYDKYKEEYLFRIIREELKLDKKHDSIYLDDNILPVIGKNNPNDLIEMLILFLEEGDTETGFISSIVKTKLIPEIKKSKDKISKDKINQANKELKKYNIPPI